MRWLNKHKVDHAIAEAVMRSADRDRGTADFTVTELISPPQVAALERLHQDEIVEDVSDGLFRLLGLAMHQVLAQEVQSEALQEKRLEMQVDGYKVSGKPDVLWVPPGTLKDYKLTSVWAFLLERSKVRPDWSAQTNLYALLLRENGYTVERAFITALLRDWVKHRTGEKDYPPIPFMEIAVPLWPREMAVDYLKTRVRLHVEAREGRYPPCSPEERWAQPDVWAVKKRGNKRALSRGLHSTAEAAKAFAQRCRFPTEIEHRAGGSVRCASYCRVAPFCSQARAMGIRRVA